MPDTHGISYPQPEPPAMGQAVTVAPGIVWLRMPLPFQLDHINVWLLEDGNGWTVVDAGIGLDETQRLWRGVLGAELHGRPVTRVVVGHFHPDHMGCAHWLAARFGVALWCPQAEWLAAQLAWQVDDLDQRLAHYRRTGVGPEMLAALRRRGHPYRQVVPSIAPEFCCLREGDTLAIGGREWRVLTLPGHSPEQLCLYAPGDDVLISGDQVLPVITTNISVVPAQPLENPLRLYLESLERFRSMLGDTLVLPSHGLPFRGLHARLDSLRLHHTERLARTADALAEPRTGADLLPILFERQLDIHQFGFAIGEALAHLHYLEWQGRAVRMVGADGIHRFQRR